MKSTHTTTTTSPVVHNPSLVASNYVQAAKNIDSLKREYSDLSVRMRQIQEEARENFAVISDILPSSSTTATHKIHARRTKVQHPRPTDDKLVISAGRAIVASIRKGANADQTRTAAIEAAAGVGKKYGLDVVPSAVLVAIDKKIKDRFNL